MDDGSAVDPLPPPPPRAVGWDVSPCPVILPDAGSLPYRGGRLSEPASSTVVAAAAVSAALDAALASAAAPAVAHCDLSIL